MKRLFSVITAVALVAGISTRLTACATQDSILVFSKTAGFRHASIPDGQAALMRLGEENGIVVDTTEDASLFNPENLGRYRAVVFLSTTRDVLDDRQQDAFQDFIRGGGGFVGIHAASDTEYEWPWYGQMVGGYFVSHPHIQEAKLDVIDRDHPSTRHLPAEWIRTDEWYNIDYVNPDVSVLVAIDEASYLVDRENPGDAYHPMSWYHEFEGGRVFYTALGHTKESFTEPEFLDHVWGGLRYVLGER